METEELLEPIKNVESCIEAVVFAAGYPVSYQKLSDVTGLGVREVKRLVEHIAKRYENDNHGIRLLRYPDTCQFATKEQYGTYIREALGIRRGGNLSASSMEVLAIVAYNQPVTRSYIDAIRGVDSTYAVNSLIDKELIMGVGRLEAPGRPMQYGTTDKFLRVFGLNTLSDLPKTEIIVPSSEDGGQQLAIAIEEDTAAKGDTPQDAEPSDSTAENANAEQPAKPNDDATPVSATPAEEV